MLKRIAVIRYQRGASGRTVGTWHGPVEPAGSARTAERQAVVRNLRKENLRMQTGECGKRGGTAVPDVRDRTEAIVLVR